LLIAYFCGILSRTQLNTQYSYPERRRDRPDDASTTRLQLHRNPGAKSGRVFWKMRAKWSLPLSPLLASRSGDFALTYQPTS
jgi:hypothetical protein